MEATVLLMVWGFRVPRLLYPMALLLVQRAGILIIASMFRNHVQTPGFTECAPQSLNLKP